MPEKLIFNTNAGILLMNDFNEDKKDNGIKIRCCVLSTAVKIGEFLAQMDELVLNFRAFFRYSKTKSKF